MVIPQAIRHHHRRLLSEEKGTVYKDPGGKITFCLAFPNRYRVGMSNLGFQFVYALLNSHPDVLCERAFLPEPELLEEYRRTRTLLLTLESSRPVKDFHVLAFSLPFENDYPNALQLLELAGVPLLFEGRGPRDPLVVAGGAAVTMNPEPLAPFLDCVLIGEAEGLLEDFLEVLRRGWDSPRQELLEALSQVEGVYVPSLYRPSYRDDGRLREIRPVDDRAPPRVKRRSFDLPRPPLISSPLVTPKGEFGDAVLVEVARGCPYRCRFCAVRTVFKPFRPRPLEALKGAISQGMDLSRRFGLLGAAVGSHPALEDLCQHILSLGGNFTLSSLRADRVTPSLARALKASGQHTATLAPEAGSEGLRKRIAKDLTDQEILEAVKALASEGITNLRLYFILGLPGEGEGEPEAIASLVKRIKHQQTLVLRGEGGRLVVSASPFVPKPWTPFQWHPYAGLKGLQHKVRTLKKALQGIKGLRFHYDLPKWAYFQTLFSLGDRRVGWELYRGFKEGNWTRHMTTAALNPDFWVMRPKAPEETFPHEIVDPGVERQALWEEYRGALP